MRFEKKQTREPLMKMFINKRGAVGGKNGKVASGGITSNHDAGRGRIEGGDSRSNISERCIQSRGGIVLRGKGFRKKRMSSAQKTDSGIKTSEKGRNRDFSQEIETGVALGIKTREGGGRGGERCSRATRTGLFHS